MKKTAILILCIFTTIFVFGKMTAFSEENQPSPLFMESLDEILEEFNTGTKKIPREFNIGPRKYFEKNQPPAPVPSENLIQKENSFRKTKEGVESNFFRPTFRSSSTCWKSATCRGIKCISLPAFPTFCGTTCSPTCGVRSSCAGYLCRFISPCAEIEKQEKMAQNNRKQIIINIF